MRNPFVMGTTAGITALVLFAAYRSGGADVAMTAAAALAAVLGIALLFDLMVQYDSTPEAFHRRGWHGHGHTRLRIFGDR